MKRLPIVKVPYKARDPKFVPKYENDMCTNLDEYHLPEAMVEAEVLTVNINTETIRVRLIEKQYNPNRKNNEEVVTFDTHIDYFYASFDIVGKGI